MVGLSGVVHVVAKSVNCALGSGACHRFTKCTTNRSVACNPSISIGTLQNVQTVPFIVYV